MKIWWLMLSNDELEHGCGLSKSTDTLGSIENTGGKEDTAFDRENNLWLAFQEIFKRTISMRSHKYSISYFITFNFMYSSFLDLSNAICHLRLMWCMLLSLRFYWRRESALEIWIEALWPNAAPYKKLCNLCRIFLTMPRLNGKGRSKVFHVVDRLIRFFLLFTLNHSNEWSFLWWRLPKQGYLIR